MALGRIGASEIAVTERGTFFGYGDLVVDMRSFSRMRESVRCSGDFRCDAQRSTSRAGCRRIERWRARIYPAARDGGCCRGCAGSFHRNSSRSRITRRATVRTCCPSLSSSRLSIDSLQSGRQFTDEARRNPRSRKARCSNRSAKRSLKLKSGSMKASLARLRFSQNPPDERLSPASANRG